MPIPQHNYNLNDLTGMFVPRNGTDVDQQWVEQTFPKLWEDALNFHVSPDRLETICSQLFSWTHLGNVNLPSRVITILYGHFAGDDFVKDHTVKDYFFSLVRVFCLPFPRLYWTTTQCKTHHPLAPAMFQWILRFAVQPDIQEDPHGFALNGFYASLHRYHPALKSHMAFQCFEAVIRCMRDPTTYLNEWVHFIMPTMAQMESAEVRLLCEFILAPAMYHLGIMLSTLRITKPYLLQRCIEICPSFQAHFNAFFKAQMKDGHLNPWECAEWMTQYGLCN